MYRSSSRSRSRTRRNSRDKDYNRRSAKSCDERGK
jgi:hypothetical protein